MHRRVARSGGENGSSCAFDDGTDFARHSTILPSGLAHSDLGLPLLLCKVQSIAAIDDVSWLIESTRFIPAEYRPPIWVRVLPALENIFYGANLSNILSAHKHVALDVLAWLPYGIFHFGAPFVCSAVMFVFAAPGTLPVFARSFGYMNLIGVIIQLLFPCSPPCTSFDM